MTNFLPVDFDMPVRDMLSRLPRTARKQRPEDSCVQSPLHGIISHVHIWRSPRPRRANIRTTIQTTSSSRGLLAAVKLRQGFVVHGHDGGDSFAEHALPLFLTHLLAMIGPRERLRLPFLLEIRLASDLRYSRAGDVVEVDFVP